MNARNLILIALASFASTSPAATFTWDGGGSDGNWSTATNWSTNVAPAATGDLLIFAGTTNTTTNNDFVTSLATSGTAITFASGAGSFTLGGNTLTLGSGGGGGQTIISQQSANAQTISANINLSGGNGDRTITFASGAGSLTLSGNINFSNDWLFPNTTAGTITLSGNNSGDGRALLSQGTNSMRAIMRNNVSGTSLVLASDTALGNGGTGTIAAGTANLRGLVANQNMTISAGGGNRNLSNSSLVINTANVTFNSTNSLTLANVINQGGNRDLWVTGSGGLTISSGLALSHDQTGRSLYVNPSNGSVTVDGQLSDTFHSGGLTTGSSTLRKAGSASMTLNGGSTSYSGAIRIEGGTLVLGHASALGNTTGGTTLENSATLDLNGQSIAENITTSGTPTLANTSTNSASITSDLTLNGNLTINTTGDLTATRLIGTATRTVTKVGAGTLTTNGSSHNNLTSWDIQAGTVVFANTSGLASDRGTTLNGGTLRLSGSNSNLINDGQSFTINSGTFDLNGKGEAVASIGGSGGTVTNTSTSAATLYVGGGVSGSSTATYGGVIQDGVGTLNLTKEGSGTQTLSGTNTYTGATVVAAGTLALASSGTINNTSVVQVNLGATLDLSAKSGYYSVANLTGNGSVNGDITVTTQLSIGSSPGSMNFTNLTLASGSTFLHEVTGGGSAADLASVSGDLTLSGSLLDVAQLGSYTLGDKFTLFAYNGSLTGTFASLADGASFTDAGGSWTIDYDDTAAGLNGGTGNLYVTITAIPEPTVAILGLSALGIALRRRRQH